MKSPLVVGLIGASLLVLWGVVVVDAQKPAGVIDSMNTEWSGVQTDLLEVRRMSDNTIRVRWQWRNITDQAIRFNPWEGYKGHTYLLDPVNQKKHLPVTDAKGMVIGSVMPGDRPLQPRESLALWVKFPAPPPNVDKVTVVIHGTAPFEDIPVSR